MKTKCIILIFLLAFSFRPFCQNNELGRVSVFAAAGYNLNPYYYDYEGFYVKIGAVYKLYKNLSANIFYWHTHAGNMPGDLRNSPNSYLDDPRFINRFIGMSHADFFAGKASYSQVNAEIINFGLCYKIYFKKGARFSISPKIGYNYCSTSTITIGLFSAGFTNDRLTGGEVDFDLRKTNVWGINAGCTFNYLIKPQIELLIDIDKFTSSSPGYDSGENFYEAANLGAGIRYYFKK
jgi:hypothetical protein